MLINLLDFVLHHLAERKVPWTCVARDTHIPYETLKKIASGRTPNPGVQHVQKLADYFSAGAPAAAVEQVAVAEPCTDLLPVASPQADINKIVQEVSAPLTANPKLRAALAASVEAGLTKPLPMPGAKRARPAGAWDGMTFTRATDRVAAGLPGGKASRSGTAKDRR